jgi:hypothetical protein
METETQTPVKLTAEQRRAKRVELALLRRCVAVTHDGLVSSAITERWSLSELSAHYRAKYPDCIVLNDLALDDAVRYYLRHQKE